MSQNDTRTFTYETRLVLEDKQERILAAYGKLFGRIEHSLFRDYISSGSLRQNKNNYLSVFGITARQFNSIAVSLEGKIKAYKASRDLHIENLDDKCKKLKKKTETLSKGKKHRSLEQKLELLQRKLQTYKEEKAAGKISLCFGGRKLFHAQFALEENGYSSHEEWRQAWEDKRSSQVFSLGSKDETAGNQSCTLMIDHQGELQVRLRLPDVLAKEQGVKHLFFSHVHWRYGGKDILDALQRKVAMSYRFLRDKKGWRLFISFVKEKALEVTREQAGSIGIDLNEHHVALTEIDYKGNFLQKKTVPLSLYGKSKEQAKALLGDVCKEIVSFAKEKGKPLIVEKLDFKKKKSEAKEFWTKQARMLSSFHYSKFSEGLMSRAFREGVGCFAVNPAMTSQIGFLKFSKRYGLNRHHAAALCIARRFYRYSEDLPKSNITVVDKGVSYSFPVPVRNRGEHVWAPWKKIFRALKQRLQRASRLKNRDLLALQHKSVRMTERSLMASV